MVVRAERQSNLELMRIVLMLLIIAHHYVVNSGALALLPEGARSNALFLLVFGMWGKAAINAFVLVTGYFMCTSRLTWVKVLRLWLQTKFYRLTIFLIFAAVGYEILSISGLLHVLFNLAENVGNGFTSSFFVFYLFIPFLNKLISALDRLELDRLLALLLAVFVGTVTLFESRAFNEVCWYVVLYLLAARIRLYPSRLTESRFATKVFFWASVALSVLSVIFLGLEGLDRADPVLAFYFMIDSSKLMAFLSGLSCFLFFKNLPMSRSTFVNSVASTTYGVLLIHASSSAMRQFLWGDLLDVTGAFSLPLPALVLHALCSVVGVFAVCSLIDYVRLTLLERPLFAWIGAHRVDIESSCLRAGERLGGLLGRLARF